MMQTPAMKFVKIVKMSVKKIFLTIALNPLNYHKYYFILIQHFTLSQLILVYTAVASEINNLALVTAGRDSALSLLSNEGLVDVGDNTASCDGCLDQSI